MKKFQALLFTTSLFLMLSINPVNATTIALDIDDSSGHFVDNSNWTLGFSFNVLSDITVTGLGLYDYHQDGLINSHKVGLWDSSGSLLAMTTVGSGTSGTLDGNFRFASISALGLTAGNLYYVGAHFQGPGDDIWVEDPTSFSTIAEISYDSRRYQSGWQWNNLAGSGSTGYFGASFQVTQAIPEPATLMLLGIGLAGLGFLRRKLVN